MSQSTTSLPRQRAPRTRSPELALLLARCPEHLFSTDADELAPLSARVRTATESVLDKAA